MILEKERLEELKSFKILDTPPEEEFDELAKLAGLICETPIAIISLVDKERQWFKATVGLDVCETARVDSFCQHALYTPTQLLIVGDTQRDPRFMNNPLVTGNPHVRFYAGAPLVTANGYVLGTICVVDTIPKVLTPYQKKALKLLARKTVDYLTMRKTVKEQSYKIDSSAEKLKKLTDNVPGGIFQLKMSVAGEMNFEFISEGMHKLHPGIDIEEWKKDATIGNKLICPEDLPAFTKSLHDSYLNLTPWYNEYRVNVGENRKWHSVNAIPEKLKDGSVIWFGSFQDITSHIEYELAMEQISFDISHVLRRPVTSLLGLMNLILDGTDEAELNLKEYAGNIKTVAAELEKFTRDLNDIYYKKNLKITNQKIRKRA